MTESEYTERVAQIEAHLAAVDDGKLPVGHLCCALGELLEIVKWQREVNRGIITTLTRIVQINDVFTEPINLELEEE